MDDTEQTLRNLVRALGSEEHLTRWVAIDAIVRFGALAVPFLVDAIVNGNGFQRFEATSALARIGPEATPALQTLVRLLAHPEPDMRYQAAYALGELGEDGLDAVSPMIDALTDEDREVRIQLASSLAKIGIHRIHWSSANDPDKEVRAQCSQLLGRPLVDDDD
jgi:HEAT repeat protein